MDAIFWLSATSVPMKTSNSLKTDGVLLKYADNKPIKKPSTLIIDGNESEEFPTVKISNVITSNTKAETIWKDGYGNPVLTAEQQNEHHNYTLYTQFNPQWTDLVWKDDFPQALMPILYHEKPTAFAFQQIQQIDDKQPIAVFEDAKPSKTRYGADRPLDQMIWVFAFIVLAVERLLNFRTKKLKVD
ncbi:hypothetical protein D3C85_1023620 [compost metagenome]